MWVCVLLDGHLITLALQIEQLHFPFTFDTGCVGGGGSCGRLSFAFGLLRVGGCWCFCGGGLCDDFGAILGV